MIPAAAARMIPYGDPWRLAGPHNAKQRAHLMGLITGQRTRQKDAGVTAIVAELEARLRIEGDCMAARSRLLAARLVTIANQE
jgi:hypothetical protein